MANATDAADRSFVGRDEEMAQIRAVVDDRSRPWLLWLIAPAGSGKSWILEETLETFDGVYPSSGLFDFFTDGLRTRDGILVALARRFLVHDGPFAEQYDAYQEALRRGDSEQRALALDNAKNALVDALRERFKTAGRGLIVTDTVERVADRAVGRWFFKEMLPPLAPWLAVIAAGRPFEGKLDAYDRLGGDHSDILNLGGLSRPAVGRLLERRVPGFNANAWPEFVNHVHAITSDDQGGQALLVDLLAHRLVPSSGPKLGPTLDLHAVMAIANAAMLRQMVVDGPLLDASAEGEVVLLMTHADHGFDAATLGAVRTPQELGLASAADLDDLLDGLKTQPFVKYHSDTKVVRVHDYFRDVARARIWPRQEPDRDTRRRDSQRLADYFKAQLDASTLAIVSPERDRLTLQWLFHLLYAQGQVAYAMLWQTLDNAWHGNRTDFMNDVLEMMAVVDVLQRPVADEHPTAAAEPSMLWRIIETVRAWSDYTSGDRLPEAVAASVAAIIADDELPRRLRLSAQEIAGMALTDTGRTEDAKNHLTAALEGYEALLATLGQAEDGNAAARAELAQELGLATAAGIREQQYNVLSHIGFIERVRCNYEEAESRFRTLHARSSEWDNPYWKAVSAYLIGNTLRYQGKILQARAWIERGVQLCRAVGFLSIIGQSLLVMGRLQRDLGEDLKAEASFAEALSSFLTIDSRADAATAHTELGWVETLRGNFTAAKARFELASQIEGELGRTTFNTPSLKEKHGKMLLRLGETADEPTERDRLFDQADRTLQEGVEVGGNLDRQLYAALCLAALVRLARLRGDETAMTSWAEHLAALRDKGLPFDWAYAEMEEELGHHAFTRARDPNDGFDANWLIEAGERYLNAFYYLARHSPVQFNAKLDALRAWLRQLPDTQRQAVGRHLRRAWAERSDVSVAQHKDFDDAVAITVGLF